MAETRNLSRSTTQVPELASRVAVTLDEAPPPEPALEYEPPLPPRRAKRQSHETEKVEALESMLPPSWSTAEDRPAVRFPRWAGPLVIVAMVLVGLVALWLQHR